MTDKKRIAELEKEVAELRQMLHEALTRPAPVQYVFPGQVIMPQPVQTPILPPFPQPDPPPTCGQWYQSNDCANVLPIGPTLTGCLP